MTKPSRALSKGRLACSGASLLVERAFMLEKPASKNGCMPASLPPASMMSEYPWAMLKKASPMALLAEAQAETGA